MFVLKASAGSGKTFNLSLQFILRLIIDGDTAFRNILAVTFTQDATSEMKFRILADLYAISNGYDDVLIENIRRELPDNINVSDDRIKQIAQKSLFNILHNYSEFNVFTIDSFFQKVLRNLARELGKGSAFNIELNTKKAVKQAVRSVLSNAYKDRELLDWLKSFVGEKIMQEKSWNIESDLDSFGLKVFDEEYQIQQYKLSEQIALNPKFFQQKIIAFKKITDNFEKYLLRHANLFFELIEENGIAPSDFASKSVPNHYKKFQNREFDFPLNATMEKALIDHTLFVTKSNPQRERLLQIMEAIFYPLLLETETFRANNMEEYISAKLCLGNIFNLGLLNIISNEIGNQSKESNRFMLQDTAMVLNAMIDPRYDSSFIYEKIGSTIYNVMIDEFQDTSFLQWRNFSSLIADIEASQNFSLIVGDVKQSIYRWRKGDWRILNNIEEEFKVIKTKLLDSNWRSAKNVIEFNNSVFRKISDILPNKIAEIYGQLPNNPFEKAYRDVEQKVVKEDFKGFVSVRLRAEDVFADLLQTLNLLAEKNYPAENICILCRTRKEIQEISNFLKNENIAGDNYNNVISDEAFLFSSSLAIQTIISVLRFMENTQNKLAALEIEFLCKKMNIKGKHTDRLEAISNLNRGSLYVTVSDIIQIFDLHTKTDQSGYIYGFLDTILDYQQNNSFDISNFLSYWEDELSYKTVAGGYLKGINIKTIHKSKGLEFGTVIIPFFGGDMHKIHQASIVWCRDKKEPFDTPIFPIGYSKDMYRSLYKNEFIDETIMSIMDMLNVYYVACTRAVQNLFIISEPPPSKSDKINLNYLLESVLEIEENRFSVGELEGYKPNVKNSVQNNPFKNINQNLLEMPFHKPKSITEAALFVQSNNSRRFTFDEESQMASFVLEGNIMHSLLSYIKTPKDIEKAVQSVVFEGVIAEEKKDNYVQRMEKALTNPEAKDWFSGKYQVLNEHAILWRDNGKTLNSIPDRVMIDGQKAIVVDYKFGQPNIAHKNQISKYIQLLEDMGYSPVEGYLWYVNSDIIEKS